MGWVAGAESLAKMILKWNNVVVRLFSEETMLDRDIMTAQDDSLHSDPILERLPADLVNGLQLSSSNCARIDRGRSIITDGQPITSVFLISEGWAISRLSIKTGDTQILDILGPGSFVGLSRLKNTGLDGYSGIALQNLKAYRIDINALRSLCSEDERLSRWLNDTLAGQMQRAQRHITALGQLPARGRLAFVMLRILDVAQQTGQSVVGETINLPMTQEEIGNMLGLTNVSISKMMSAFRSEGLIEYGRNRIVIRDVDGLTDICGMEMEDIRAINPFVDFGGGDRGSTIKSVI